MTQWSGSSTLTKETIPSLDNLSRRLTLSITRPPSTKVSRSNNSKQEESSQKALSSASYNHESKKRTNTTRPSHPPDPASANTTQATSRPSRAPSPLEPPQAIRSQQLLKRSLKTLASRCKWPQATRSNAPTQAVATESSF